MAAKQELADALFSALMGKLPDSLFMGIAKLATLPKDIMDAMLQRARGPSPKVMSDVWDAPVFRELLMPDGSRFLDAPPR